MKQYILGISLGAAAVATGFGVWAVLGQNVNTLGGTQAAVDTLMSTARLYQLAGISGLFSIASFFVGLAYPMKTTIVANVDGTVSQIAV